MEGYDERIPSILLMMQRFLVENKGRDQARSCIFLAKLPLWIRFSFPFLFVYLSAPSVALAFRHFLSIFLFFQAAFLCCQPLSRSWNSLRPLASPYASLLSY